MKQPEVRAAPTGLTQRAASGFAWSVLQTVGTKVVGFVGQMILARLLLREDFGQVALAYTVAAFAGLLQQAGLRESLILRRERFARWSGAAFWMSLALGLAATAAMGVAAPLAARAYGAPEVIGLVWIVALAAPLNSVSVVPAAKLQADLRFKAVSAIGFLELSLQTALSVIFAAPPLSMGPYSFVLPLPIVSAVRLAAMWWLARPPVGWRLQLRRWRLLYREGALILGAYLFFTVIMQGDYVVLKLVSRSTEEVGVYYFAFVLSMQAVVVLTVSLVNVLLPVLSQLQDDPIRQTNAFLRAIRVLAVISVPACLLQAVLGEPLVRLFFGAKWLPAVPVLQVLSLGMAARIVAAPVHSMMKAQGRFGAYFAFSLVYAAGFVPLAAAGAWLGGAVGTAAGVATSIWVFELWALYVAVRPSGGRWSDIMRVYALPTGLSAFAAALAMGAVAIVPAMPGEDVARLVIGTAVMAAIYLPLVRRLAPEEWGEVATRTTALLARVGLRRCSDAARV